MPAVQAIELRDPLKFDFYAARGVEEIMVVDWRTRSVRCFHVTRGVYEERSRSALLDVDTATLVHEIDWP